MAPRFGAEPKDWERFAALGLTDDLLPVVSDPAVPISSTSKMQDKGKTPSTVKSDGTCVGISGWSRERSDTGDVRRWTKDGRLGICLQTRRVRAFDVDISDPAISASVRETIELVAGKLPCRSRGNSGKLLLAFRLEGQFSKRRINTPHGPIEFLANGQQFIAAGTHPSGARYEWDEFDEFPTLCADEVDAIWLALAAAYGSEPVDIGERKQTGHDDPVMGLTPEDMRACLKALDPGMEYSAWMNVAGMLHHETRGADLGLDLWDEWSMGGVDYPGREYLEYKWSTLGKRHSGSVVTARSLKMLAQKADSTLVLSVDVAPPDAFEDITAAAASGELADWPTFSRDKAGRIEPTISNTVAAVRCQDFSQARVGRDSFKDTVMVAYNCVGQWRPLRDTDYTQIRMQLEGRGFKAPGRELVRDAVLKVAEDYEFDSAIQWGESLRWDGTPRVDAFLNRYFNAEPSQYASAVSRYLWTAMAGRMLKPGEEVHMVVVLVGPQGTGKSRGVRALAPEPDAYVEINLEHRDENQARLMRGKLVGELGELRGLQTRDAEGIKAWITRPVEEWTPKYQEFSVKFPRRLVFIGTTNDDDFLGDPTGERRWLPVRVGLTDLPAIDRDRDQLWAEAIHLYRAGGVQWTEAHDLAIAEHAEFKGDDAWDEAVYTWLAAGVGAFEMDEEETPRWTRRIKLPVLMRSALHIQDKDMHPGNTKRVAKILKRLGFEKARAKRGEGKSVWVAAAECVFNVQNSTCDLV